MINNKNNVITFVMKKDYVDLRRELARIGCQ
jgi:hypothetical protein